MLAVFRDDAAHQKCGYDGVVKDISRKEPEHVAIQIIATDPP